MRATIDVLLSIRCRAHTTTSVFATKKPLTTVNPWYLRQDVNDHPQSSTLEHPRPSAEPSHSKSLEESPPRKRPRLTAAQKEALKAALRQCGASEAS